MFMAIGCFVQRCGGGEGGSRSFLALPGQDDSGVEPLVQVFAYTNTCIFARVVVDDMGGGDLL